MNELSKIDMANLVFSNDKKAKIKDVLCSKYGATDVQYRDLTYGICIDVVGTDSFRFVKNAFGIFIKYRKYLRKNNALALQVLLKLYSNKKNQGFRSLKSDTEER
jgi:hypothetical protein